MTVKVNRSNKVGSYQIILSVDPFVIDRMKDKVTASRFLFDEIINSRFSTIFNSADSNFIEMRHDFNSEKRTGSTVNINMFDPGLNFLNEMFFQFNQRSLKTITNAKKNEDTEIRRLFSELKNKDADILDSEEGIELVDKYLSETPQYIEKFSEDVDGLSFGGYQSAGRTVPSTDADQYINQKIVNEDYLNIQKTKETQLKTLQDLQHDKALLVDRLQAIISRRSMPKVYVMYGIGNDLKDWAGPFETFLGDVKHKNNGKQETVEYELVVDYLSEQLSVEINSLDAKANLFRNGSIPFLAFGDRDSIALQRFKSTGDQAQPRRGGLPQPVPSETPDLPLSTGESLQFPTKSYTIHDIIVKLLSNYLFKLGIKNHIILLPYLDYMLAALLERCVLLNMPKLGVKTFSNNTVLSGKQGEERLNYVTSISNYLLKNDVENLLDLVGPGELPRPNVDPALFESASEQAQRNLFNTLSPRMVSVKKKQFIDSVFKDFFRGLALQPRNAEGDSDYGAPVFMSVDESRDFVQVKDPFQRDVNNFTATDPYTGQAGTLEAQQIMSIKFGDKYSEVETAEEFKWQDPLRDIIFNLNKASSAQTITYDAFFVGDKKTKDILIKKFGGGTFPGYAYSYSVDYSPTKTEPDIKLPKTEPINDDPFLIFGDRELIRLFIYGSIISTKTGALELLDDEDALVLYAGVPQSVMKRNYGELQDPIWNSLAGDINDLTVSRNSYFDQVYEALHKTPGYNLGYYLDILTDPDQLAFTLPDEFSLQPSDNPETEEKRKKQRQYLFDTAFPIFLANTANSNVLSYSFDTNKFIYSQLFGTIREVYGSVAKRFYTEDNPVLDPDMDAEQRAQKMVEVLEIVRAKSSGIGSRLSTGFGVGKKVDIDEMADLLVDLMLLETAGISRGTRKGKGSSIVAFLSLFMDLFSQAYAGSVRTLPMFHLHKHSDLLQQCLVMLKPVKRIKPNTNDYSNDNRTMDFLSGIYRMTGFTHRITSNEAYSEFKVFKDFRAELNNAED